MGRTLCRNQVCVCVSFTRVCVSAVQVGVRAAALPEA